MIEGIIVANYLAGARADLARSALWLAIDGDAGRQPTPEDEPARPDSRADSRVSPQEKAVA
ncbi:MAG: hypothetical protein F4072_04600 [Acidimicrobiaceae bacterium]|nr:hypothetical protein [Acidimicrobiaceae bacterium]